ncbi:MAG: VapC toxin family PIN domain ribonuclease [Candidatus Angelobacter sp. Gp1-AA117]|nr:MAG: VapC toxin family PIN domain ribonuclease [Candidatus Angelobacter sp. Gp1-AA117]
MSLVLDTHAAVWYLLKPGNLSNTALQRIRHTAGKGQPLYISAISIIELIYLVERGRIPRQSLEKLMNVVKDPASGFLVADVTVEISQAVENVSRDVVPEMPDRIITATALHLDLPLVTRDAKIQAAGITSIW